MLNALDSLQRALPQRRRERAGGGGRAHFIRHDLQRVGGPHPLQDLGDEIRAVRTVQP